MLLPPLLPPEITLEKQGIIKLLADQNVTDIPPNIAGSVALTKTHLITILNALGIRMEMLGNVITFSTVKGGAG